MTISSMTGFARVEGGADGYSWGWELRSLNGRSLDLRLRLPSGFEELDPKVRAAVSERFVRGSLSVTLSVQRESGAAALVLNEARLAEVAAIARRLQEELEALPPSVDGLLAIDGVLERVDSADDDDARAARAKAILGDLNKAIEALSAMRAGEGARLMAVADTLLEEIAALTDEAVGLAALRPDAVRERFRAQVAEILDQATSLPEDRLLQEMAVLGVRGDVREELDRLAVHVHSARELLASGEAVGRRLDFLCQEFNREANTLCSKSSDTELTRVGLALKAAIDRLREQVQNIE